jgi:hypothetical protein
MAEAVCSHGREIMGLCLLCDDIEREKALLTALDFARTTGDRIVLLKQYAALARPSEEPVAWGAFLPDGRLCESFANEALARKDARKLTQDTGVEMTVRPLYARPSDTRRLVVTEAMVEAALVEAILLYRGRRTKRLHVALMGDTVVEDSILTQNAHHLTAALNAGAGQ